MASAVPLELVPPFVVVAVSVMLLIVVGDDDDDDDDESLLWLRLGFGEKRATADLSTRTSDAMRKARPLLFMQREKRCKNTLL